MTLPAALACLALYLISIGLVLMFFAGARETGDDLSDQFPQSDGLPLSARRPVPGAETPCGPGDTPSIAGTAQHHARRAGGIADLLHKD